MKITNGHRNLRESTARDRIIVNRPLWPPCSRLDLQLLDAVALGGDLGEVSHRLGLRLGAVERHLDRLDRVAKMPLTLRSSHATRLTSAVDRGLGVVGAVAPSYKGFRYPVEIISNCVWLYHRFPLSFREVEEMMLARGVLVTYETIRQWCRKFGQTYANGLRRRRPRPGDK